MDYTNSNHPKIQHLYAITTGTYVGEMFCMIETQNNSYRFISIPKNINREVPIDKFNIGLVNKIIEHVEKLPDEVYNVLKAQYKYNENLNYRRQQLTSPGVLDIHSHKE